MEGISVITPTGGRPEAFRLCERWMAKQSYEGDIQWIIVNDCGDYEKSLRMRANRRVIELPHEDGNTQHRNLLAAFDAVENEKIIIVEDDDHYSSTYLEHMADLLEQAELAGQFPTLCYNVKFRAWLDYRNESHASLCMTGFRREVMTGLKQICERREFIDLSLWSMCYSKALSSQRDVLTMKGMPGRPGVMPQHAYYDPRFKKDEKLEKLREFIGEDAELYRGFYSNHPV